MLQALEAMKRPARLERNQLDCRIELAQTTTPAHERAARAQSGYEVREPTTRLFDDLRPRCVVVRAPISIVAVLIRIEILVRLRRMKAARLANGPVSCFKRIGQNELGPERPQNHLSLRACVRRKAKFDTIRSEERGGG